MYVCNQCGYEFDEPAVEYETHGFDYPPYEKLYVCPNCKDYDYEEMTEHHLCDCCHCNISQYDPYYETNDGHIYCIDCIEVVE